MLGAGLYVFFVHLRRCFFFNANVIKEARISLMYFKSLNNDYLIVWELYIFITHIYSVCVCATKVKIAASWKQQQILEKSSVGATGNYHRSIASYLPTSSRHRNNFVLLLDLQVHIHFPKYLFYLINICLQFCFYFHNFIFSLLEWKLFLV